MPVRKLLRLVPVTMVLAWSTTAATQQPSAWAELPLPANVNQLPTIQFAITPNVGPGKLAMVRDGQYLQVYSTVTGRWHAFTPSFGTTPRLLHDLLLVPESDRWTAFSAYRGVFEPLFVSFATSTITTGKSIAVVRNGTSAWAFSAYTGQWHAHPAPTGWNVDIGDRFATLTSPAIPPASFGGLALFDALTGSWHDLPAQNAVRLGGNASGSTAMQLFRRQDQSLYVATWSSDSPGWQTQNVNAVPPLFNLGGGGTRGSELVSAWDLGYSGLSRTVVPSGIAYLPFVAGLVMSTWDAQAQQPHCLGIRSPTWTPLPIGAQLVDPNFYAPPRGVQLFALGNQTVAFSGITGTYASVASLTRGVLQGSVVAANADPNTGAVSVYSAATGQWQALPPTTLAEPITPPLPPVVRGTNTAVVLATTSGVTAFSGRTGRFVPLPGTNFTRDGNRAFDGTTLWFFDARSDRWLGTPQPSGSWSWTDTAFVGDSPTALTGYGVRSSRLEVLAEPSPLPRTVHALDGGAVVQQSGKLFGFTGLPDNLSLYGFPEDFDACGPGTTFRHQMRLAPGSAAILGIGPRIAAPIALPPLGELWLDPNQFAVLNLVTAPAGEPRAVMSLPVPNVPQLQNTEWFLQSLVLPAVGQPYLTDFASVYFL